MARLVQECLARNIAVIDCQVASSHLASLGAREVSRNDFVAMLRKHAERAPSERWLDGPALPTG